MGTDKKLKREKNWKLIYLRSEKLARAKQLGFEYPRRDMLKLAKEEQEMKLDRMNLLFICSRNQWRSPTAERIWHRSDEYNVRSAGTSPKAKKTVSSKDISWADIIFVMEVKHKDRLVAEFTRMVTHKPIHVLDIPDEYRFMDPELVSELKMKVDYFLP